MSTTTDIGREIRIVGFDLDQTLYPKSPAIDERIQKYIYEKIAEHRNVNLATAQQLFAERYRGGAGLSGRQSLEDLGVPDAANIVQEALERADIASVLTPNPQTNTFLTRLTRRFAGVDLITGSNLEQTTKKLGALSIQPTVFTHVITENDAQKATGDAYRLWLSKYPHIEPGKFLYVGDRVRSDHEVPSELGIKTALVYRASDPNITAYQFGTLTELLEVL